MNLVEYPDRELMMFGLADALASDLGAALRQNDQRQFLRFPAAPRRGRYSICCRSQA